MRFSGWLLLVAAILFSSGCGDTVETFDTNTGVDVAEDVSQPDNSPVDVVEDISRYPDMGGNGMISVTQPSAELALRITTPSNRGYQAVQAPSVALGGLYFGTLESLTFKMDGIDDGPITWSVDSPYWQTAVIALKRGDNRITVIATGRGDADDPEADPVTVSDEIIITYNPNLYFPAPLRMSPPNVFVGRTQSVLARINMGLFGGEVAEGMYVVRQNPDGSVSESLGEMRDGGMVDAGVPNGSSDEISGDGVFTARVTVRCDQVETQLFRAAVEVTTESGSYTAYSAPFQLQCLQAIDSETCTAHYDTLTRARKAFYNAIDSGQTDRAMYEAYRVIASDDAVVESSSGYEYGGGIWVRFGDGVLGALNLFKEGNRGGPGDGGESGALVVRSISDTADRDQIISRETLLMSPFFTEFGKTDEVQKVAEIVSEIECPVFTLKGPYNGSGASLEKFRQLGSSGIIAVSTHSDVFFKGLSRSGRANVNWRHPGGQEILWTGESINCGRIGASDETCESSADCPAGSTCIITDPPEEYTETVQTDAGSEQVVKYTDPKGTCFDTTHADLMAGRIVLGDRTWGVTPEFIEFYADEQRLPGSLVYLGGCRTLYNGSLAMALLASGARTVLGYSNRVSGEFAYQSGYDFFFNFLMKTLPAGEAYAGGDADPVNPGSFFRLFGALDLSASFANILNPGFETSDASAWVTEGDGRVITVLGETTPIAGKFMGIISTGLGFTTKTGKISQSFCIPAGATELEFYWKYYSEEFHEFCGSAYQDAFLARLTTRDGNEYPVVDIKVDDLCAADNEKCEEGQCGSQFVGLEESDVQFDRGDTHTTTWQKASFSLADFDSEVHHPVTISFYCTDVGDSIFDTAVLVDSVSFR